MASVGVGFAGGVEGCGGRCRPSFFSLSFFYLLFSSFFYYFFLLPPSFFLLCSCSVAGVGFQIFFVVWWLVFPSPFCLSYLFSSTFFLFVFIRLSCFDNNLNNYKMTYLLFFVASRVKCYIHFPSLFYNLYT